MGNNPAWYDKLPEWAQEAVDQTAHSAMGIFCGLTSTELYLWWRENIKQWPPGKPIWAHGDGQRLWIVTHPEQCSKQCIQYFPADRVWDKSRDELFYSIGTTVGSLARAAALIYGGFRWW